jgi:hypothetical protein
MILQIRGVKYQPRSKSVSRTIQKYSKESTNIVGSLRMKPTVSESKKGGFNHHFEQWYFQCSKQFILYKKNITSFPRVH